MTTNRTADDVLDRLRVCLTKHEIESANWVDGRCITFVQAKQQLLADLLALPEMQDETAPGYGSATYPVDNRSRIGKRNELREELRQALQDYFMGGDVGADDGGLDKLSPEQTSVATKPVTFVVYRTEAKNVVEAHEQSNYLDADQVQFEGVEFWDGTVAIRWRTPTTSMSFWESMEALKRVHIYTHPDHGTRVEWSDGKVEQL